MHVSGITNNKAVTNGTHSRKERPFLWLYNYILKLTKGFLDDSYFVQPVIYNTAVMRNLVALLGTYQFL